MSTRNDKDQAARTAAMVTITGGSDTAADLVRDLPADQQTAGIIGLVRGAQAMAATLNDEDDG